MTTTSKRDRLIEAAKMLFYQQGVARSTLADIAQQAHVPLGNTATCVWRKWLTGIPH